VNVNGAAQAFQPVSMSAARIDCGGLGGDQGQACKDVQRGQEILGRLWYEQRMRIAGGPIADPPSATGDSLGLRRAEPGVGIDAENAIASS
jgi:hypothetical protein